MRRGYTHKPYVIPRDSRAHQVLQAIADGNTITWEIRRATLMLTNQNTSSRLCALAKWGLVVNFHEDVRERAHWALTEEGVVALKELNDTSKESLREAARNAHIERQHIMGITDQMRADWAGKYPA